MKADYDYIKKFEELKKFSAAYEADFETVASEWVSNGGDLATVQAHEEKMIRKRHVRLNAAANKAGVVFGKRS